MIAKGRSLGAPLCFLDAGFLRASFSAKSSQMNGLYQGGIA